MKGLGTFKACGKLREAGESAENFVAGSECKKQRKSTAPGTGSCHSFSAIEAETDVVPLCLVNLSMMQLSHKAESLSLRGMGTWTGTSPPTLVML